MEDLVQPTKRLNDLFFNFLGLRKVVNLNPLQFDVIDYAKYDWFENVKTGTAYYIIDRKGKNYEIKQQDDIYDLQIGDWTVFKPNFASESRYKKVLRKILVQKDYYYAADILYDLSLQKGLKSDDFEYLTDLILKICDETDTGKSR